LDRFSQKVISFKVLGEVAPRVPFFAHLYGKVQKSRRLAADPGVGVLMNRFNTAQRKRARSAPYRGEDANANRRVHGDTLGHAA
jgi:hypothetical protein